MTTTEQLDVFAEIASMEEGRRRRDEAIARVEANASTDWQAIALRAVSWVAMTRETFTADDVWAAIPDAETHERRAMGAVMRRACSIGYCTPTDVYVQSERPTRHAAPIRVWRSSLVESATLTVVESAR